MTDLLIAHGTHPGETGKNNEDNYAVKTFHPDGGESLTLGIVADGIGGHRAGEVASELVTRVIIEVVGQSTGQNYRAILEEAITQAARKVAEQANSKPEYHGMGTTCVAALIANCRLYTAYIGDSRLYLIQRQTIQQISIDHTWVQEAVEHGVLTPEEAKQSPQRHIVRRHLGNNPDVKPDFRLRLTADETPEQSEQNQGLLLEPGDAVLLCSDGLSDLAEADEILNILMGHPSTSFGFASPRDPSPLRQAQGSGRGAGDKRSGQALQAAVEELIMLARKRGGPDNITIVVMQIPQ